LATKTQEYFDMAEQRRLERQNGIIAGVCGGIAVRFRISPFIVRLIFFILLLPGGLPGLLPYLILWILMPKHRE
jgi:phage shock protein C